MEFDIQRYLEQMEHRADQRHGQIARQIEDVAITLSEHSTRLVVLEGADKRRRWYAATVATAFVTFLFDLLVNHWGKH